MAPTPHSKRGVSKSPAGYQHLTFQRPYIYSKVIPLPSMLATEVCWLLATSIIWEYTAASGKRADPTSDGGYVNSITQCCLKIFDTDPASNGNPSHSHLRGYPQMRTCSAFSLYLHASSSDDPMLPLEWDSWRAWHRAYSAPSNHESVPDLCTFNVEKTLVRMMRLGCIYDAGYTYRNALLATSRFRGHVSVSDDAWFFLVTQE